MQTEVVSPCTGWGKSAQHKRQAKRAAEEAISPEGRRVASHDQNDVNVKGTWELHLWPQSSSVIPGQKKTSCKGVMVTLPSAVTIGYFSDFVVP